MLRSQIDHYLSEGEIRMEARLNSDAEDPAMKPYVGDHSDAKAGHEGFYVAAVTRVDGAPIPEFSIDALDLSGDKVFGRAGRGHCFPSSSANAAGVS